MKEFGLVVLPSGKRAYCIQYRNPDRIQKRLKIGVHVRITTKEARVLAIKQLSKVVHGEDPMPQKKTKMALPRMSELAVQCFARHAERKREKSQNEDKAMLNRYILPAFGDKRVSQITFHQIQSHHLKLKDTPSRANRILGLLSKIPSASLSQSGRVHTQNNYGQAYRLLS